MAFNINPGKQQFSATAAQTVFTFNFAIFAGTDLKVYKTLAGAVANDITDLLTLTTHYTVSINGTLGGTVTLLSGASLNDTITVVRSLLIARTTDYVTNGDLYAEILDLDQDYQTYLVLDQNVQLERAIIVPESLASIDLNIPAPVANSYLRWNVTANALENDTSIPNDVVTTTANVALTNADVISTHADVIAASASATSSQLLAWEAEAEKLTADSYATEPENVFVKTYVSDGDGTFTATNTSEYSALHWSSKALINANFAPTIHGATSKVTPVDADEIPIVDSASTFGLKKLTWANLKTTLGVLFAPLASPALTGTPTAPAATVVNQLITMGSIIEKTVASIGYGTGAGGTVTQATSKSTSVTLNKPCGQITMNNAALAANTAVRFTLNTTLLAPTDTIIINFASTIGNVDTNYNLSWSVGTNSVNITLKNVSAGSLSEAVVINFAVIKGVTA